MPTTATPLILIARVFGGLESEEATMTSVDRLGFHVRLKTAEGMRGARIAFLREVTSPAETRAVLVEMTQQARAASAVATQPEANLAPEAQRLASAGESRRVDVCTGVPGPAIDGKLRSGRFARSAGSA